MTQRGLVITIIDLIRQITGKMVSPQEALNELQNCLELSNKQMDEIAVDSEFGRSEIFNQFKNTYQAYLRSQEEEFADYQSIYG